MSATIRSSPFNLAFGGILFVALVMPLFAQAGNDTWMRDVERGLDGVRLDGTANVRFVILDDPWLHDFGISLELVHRLEIDARGKVTSQWGVPGLQALVASVGRTQRRAKLPAGPPLVWSRSESSTVSHGCRVAALPDGSWAVGTPAGVRWIFREGIPVEVRSLQHGTQMVTSRGAWITSIGSPETDASTEHWLQAEYDEGGRVTRLSVRNSGIHQFRWSPEGELEAWIQPGGQVVQFKYWDGLICGIEPPDGRGEEFTWAENEGWRRGDTFWASPVHLTANRSNRCDVAMTERGIRIARYPKDQSKMTETTFNMVSGRLEQWDGQVRKIYLPLRTPPTRPRESAEATLSRSP